MRLTRERVDERFIVVRRERGGTARCRRCGGQVRELDDGDLLAWIIRHDCADDYA